MSGLLYFMLILEVEVQIPHHYCMMMMAHMLVIVILAGLLDSTCGYLVASRPRSFSRHRELRASSVDAITELPNSFDASVSEAVTSTLASTADGWARLRVDFDTSAGDATYTALKNSLPFTKKFVEGFVAPFLAQSDSDSDSAEPRTVRLYFPDAGSAALCHRDWKIGQPGSLVPSCVRLSSLSVR